MLFASGTPVVNIADITNIKIQKSLSYTIVNISILESGRIKQRGLILEKEQIQPLIDTLLEENLLDKKDIKISTKREKIRLIIFSLYIISTCLFLFYNPKQLHVTTYFQAVIMLIISLVIIVKMLRNSVFLNREILEERFSGE